jgi:peptide/nickel transport system substrate-binding protein
MPERLAATSPFKPVEEIVGSGPYRFLPEEHIIGARAVYERFALYQPRAGGPAGFTSGPKIAHFDRIEWLTLDPFSAMAALRSGEIDWWEVPLNDEAEGLARYRDITVVSQYATAMGFLRFNHLHPPFNNAEVRRALLGAVDQAEAMTAVAGTDRASWRDGIGLFAAGTPLAMTPGSRSCAGHAITRRFGRRWRAPAITAKRSSFSLRPTPRGFARCRWREQTSCATPA